MNSNIIKGISVGLGTIFVASNFYTISLLSKKSNLPMFDLPVSKYSTYEIEADMNRYLDIFRRHNLTKLAAAKPGLIEPRMNKATKEVFDGIENDSNLISNLNN